MRGEAKRKLGRTPKRVTGGYMYADYNRMKNAHERLVESLRERTEQACRMTCAGPSHWGDNHDASCLKARAVLAEMGEK